MTSRGDRPQSVPSAKRGEGKTLQPDASPQLSFEQRFAAAQSKPASPAALAIPAEPVKEPAKEARILAVGELVRAARQTMEARFGDVRVEGEVSGCKRS
ncbi:MAG TPA: exodeoxyribonuclease VII large subunit, partial [Polyangia bacterium]